MLVGRTQFKHVVSLLCRRGQYGLDTETTGLKRNDRLFSIIIADPYQAYYFNFNSYKGLEEEYRLPRAWLPEMQEIFNEQSSTFFIHNAKFDLHMLAKEGLDVAATVHCTLAIERVLQNNYIGKGYSLDACAQRRGLKKDSAVEEYIKKHKLISKVPIPNTDEVDTIWHFDQVPWEVITTYGENDAKLHRAIGLDQLEKLKLRDLNLPHPKTPTSEFILANEKKLTKVCFRIEDRGAKIDVLYVVKALNHTMDMAAIAKQEFETLTGIPYGNSPAVLAEAFKRLGIELPKTPTGKAATNKKVLDTLKNPIADKIRQIRSLEQLCVTYYSSFLYYADSEGLIHANMRQGGTETGRFSYSDPNLQNLPKEDAESDKEKPYLVRRSFVPLAEDWLLVAIDYKQQEFRVMLDYAGEHKLIQEILGGLDVHEATGNIMGVKRGRAKTLNFGLLYGMGNETLGEALHIPTSEARDLRADYFAKLPGVQSWIASVKETGRTRGYVYNWAGFMNHIASPEYAYILPNHLIQGSCAQVIRLAMVQVDDYMIRNRLRSHMIAQVHDELLWQFHTSEIAHVQAIQRIMENVYVSRNGMRLDCSVEYSAKSWAKWDMQKGAP